MNPDIPAATASGGGAEALLFAAAALGLAAAAIWVTIRWNRTTTATREAIGAILHPPAAVTRPSCPLCGRRAVETHTDLCPPCLAGFRAALDAWGREGADRG